MAKAKNILEQFKELAKDDFKYKIRLNIISGTISEEDERLLVGEYPSLIINRTDEPEVTFHMSNGKKYTI